MSAETIVNQIAGLDVAVGVTTVRGIQPGEHEGRVNTPPLHMVTISDVSTLERELTLDGSVRQSTHTITDTMLWAATTQGAGVKDHQPDLLKYVDALKGSVRNLNLAVEQIGPSEPGIYNYPNGSDSWWFAVRTPIVVKEVVYG